VIKPKDTITLLDYRSETKNAVCGGDYIQGHQNISVHLMITIQKVTSNIQSLHSPDIY
jgi:hypothetical protein